MKQVQHTAKQLIAYTHNKKYHLDTKSIKKISVHANYKLSLKIMKGCMEKNPEWFLVDCDWYLLSNICLGTCDIKRKFDITSRVTYNIRPYPMHPFTIKVNMHKSFLVCISVLIVHRCNCFISILKRIWFYTNLHHMMIQSDFVTKCDYGLPLQDRNQSVIQT